MIASVLITSTHLGRAMKNESYIQQQDTVEEHLTGEDQIARYTGDIGPTAPIWHFSLP